MPPRAEVPHRVGSGDTLPTIPLSGSRLCECSRAYRTCWLHFPESWVGILPEFSGLQSEAHRAGDRRSILGSGRLCGEGNDNTLQYYCLENSIDRKSGRLQSLGSLRIGHGWATNTFHSFYWTYLRSFRDVGLYFPQCPWRQSLWSQLPGQQGGLLLEASVTLFWIRERRLLYRLLLKQLLLFKLLFRLLYRLLLKQLLLFKLLFVSKTTYYLKV